MAQVLPPLSQLGSFRGGVDSARCVVAIVVFCRSSSYNSSCDAIVRTIEGLLYYFLCLEGKSSCAIVRMKGTFQTCFKCGWSGKYCSRVPCRFHPLPQNPINVGSGKTNVFCEPSDPLQHSTTLQTPNLSKICPSDCF